MESDLRLLMLTGGTALLAYVFMGIAAKGRWLRNDVNERSNHTVPTSRAGGLIGLAFVTFVIAAAQMGSAAGSIPPVVTAALFAGILGAIDDLVGLPSGVKLLVLAVISGFAAWGTGPLGGVPLPWGGVLNLPGWLGVPLSVLFVLGFANAFNFMDGLNGLAAGAGMCGLALLLFSAGQYAPGLSLTLMIAAAAMFAFALRNVVQGQIFLGDAGSLSLGVMLSGSALHLDAVGARTGGSAGAVIMVFCIAFLPYLVDTISTVIRRGRRGEPVLQAHTEHAYQRLHRQGFSHQAVASLYTALIAGGGTFALLAAMVGEIGLWLSALVALAAYLVALRVAFRQVQARRIAELNAKSSKTSRSWPDGTTPSASAARSA